MSRILHLRPLNRNLLIVPHNTTEKKTQSGVLLPEDFEQDLDRYIEATVIDIAPDCSPQLSHLRHGNIEDKVVIVDRSMIEKVMIKDRTHYFVLENYVLGCYGRTNEN